MKLMKPFIVLPYLILIIAMFSACNGSEVRENNSSARLVAAKPVAGERYLIDQKESVVTWKCLMQFVTGGHAGYVDISKGELMIEKGELVGGKVEIDMKTIGLERHGGGSDNNLIDHIKSPDFFDVEKFPSSWFVISAVASSANNEKIVTGILTIKEISQTVSFPAKIEVKNGIVNASGKLTIDRTNWDVRYKSGKFYDLLADEVISDNIEFDVKIVAMK